MSTHIEANGHLVTIFVNHTGRPLRILQCGGADVHTCGAGVERGIQGGIVTHAARHLDVHLVSELPDDLTQLGAVVPRAEGGVEIDQVDPLRPGVHPRACGVERRAIVRLRTGLTLT